MHSHPALVLMACWKGEVACSTTGPNCWDMVRATNRLITSPATIPLTLPPPGFCNAVILPRLIICATPSGIWPLAKISPTTKNKCVSRALSRRGRRCSVVIPDGPPAAPFLAVLRFRANLSSSRLKARAGWNRKISCGMGLRGCAGRLTSLVNSARVD